MDYNRKVLPICEPEYYNTDLDAEFSTPPERFTVKAPEGAPNVLLVVLDDMGFGASSSFGGPVHMACAEKLSQEGILYSRFHTTALCAPTRTAVLTGYNHHSNNMGTISEMGTAFPGNTSVRPKTVTTIARILQENGYSTAQFGKCHEVPTFEITPYGPYNHWPTNSGFDKFYGFMGGETNQYHPELFDGTTLLPPVPDKGYHLSEDLAKKTMEWISLQQQIKPDHPFFVYLAPGATHSPHHAPKEYIDKYKGQFDGGWDHLRETILENMKRKGIVPEDTVLAPKPEGMPDWDTLSETDQMIFARQMEVYAGFAEHVDAQIGKVIEFLKKDDVLKDTLVIYMLGDNGASAEGLMSGLYNEHTTMNGVKENPEVILEHLDKLGGEEAFNHYSAAWAIAMDTPFTWAKQVASNFGGTRNGLIISYPEKIKKKGRICTQFHHCIDIAPTILEAVGIPHPELVDGVKQRAPEGTSMCYTFDDQVTGERHHTQYFCIGANYGIYHRGWFAGVVSKIPWIKQPRYSSVEDGIWELYHVDQDFSMAKNLVDLYPQKLEELRNLFFEEARKYNVLPIDSRGHQLFNASYAGRPDFSVNCRHMVLNAGTVGLKESCFPNIKNHSFTIDADVEVTAGDTDGVILAQGGRFGGWAMYVKDGYLTFAYNYLALHTDIIRSSRKLDTGTSRLSVIFTYDGGGVGKGGLCELSVNGVKSASQRIEQTIPMLITFCESTSVGRDTGTAVVDEYTIADSQFSGNIYQVEVNVES